jgi:phosphatidylserine/phosphatidylglycerophosphate/cardiolipin synthase-like enzyme
LEQQLDRFLGRVGPKLPRRPFKNYPHRSAARDSILVKMFLFSEPRLIRALVAAHKRGVKVRVMLNPARRSGKSENGEAKRRLKAGGIAVRDTHPEFDVSHEKSMVDGQVAFVKSHNWAPKNFGGTHDYAVITAIPTRWPRSPRASRPTGPKIFDPDRRRLIWCRGNGRAASPRFIDGPEGALLQNERYQDPTIIERLVAAHARRQGPSHVAAAARPEGQEAPRGRGGLRVMRDIGIKIHSAWACTFHAKMLLADGKRVIVGLMNIAPGSFDSRRELAIEIEDKPWSAG